MLKSTHNTNAVIFVAQVFLDIVGFLSDLSICRGFDHTCSCWILRRQCYLIVKYLFSAMDFYNSCAIYKFVLGHYTVTYFQNNYCTLFGKTNTSLPLLGSSCFTGTPSPSPSPSSLSLHCYYFYKVRAKLPLPVLTKKKIIDPGFNQPPALPPSSWLQFFFQLT